MDFGIFLEEKKKVKIACEIASGKIRCNEIWKNMEKEITLKKKIKINKIKY